MLQHQELLNKEMDQTIIGGCARLVLIVLAISSVWAALVLVIATLLLVLAAFRPLSESSEQCKEV